MNIPHLELLTLLLRATVFLSVAALAVHGILRITRPRSPVVHRTAWLLVLLQGILFVRIGVDLPVLETAKSQTNFESRDSDPGPRVSEAVLTDASVEHWVADDAPALGESATAAAAPPAVDVATASAFRAEKSAGSNGVDSRHLTRGVRPPSGVLLVTLRPRRIPSSSIPRSHRPHPHAQRARGVSHGSRPGDGH